LNIRLPDPPQGEPLTAYEDEFLGTLYRRMFLIRTFEEKVNELFLRGLMPGTIHLSHGQEAVSVGACAALRREDVITPTHRGHGQALAKGMPPRTLMAELFGKAAGCCRGKGGSLHIGDMSAGVLPAIAIVGAASPIAVGMAFAFKRSKAERIVCNFHGDGAVNKGEWHEAMNLAALWSLPVVFLCENNLFGVSTHISDVVLNEFLAERAAAYRMEGRTIYGNDPIEVYRTVEEAAEKARSGAGPTFIEALTYRRGGHKRDDPATYRDREEVAAWLAQDPVAVFRQRLLDAGRLEAEAVRDLESEAAAEIEDAVEFARHSPEPSPDTALEDVYA
jgi:pyruvate dehydrogenase E1 component alpha subunit